MVYQFFWEELGLKGANKEVFAVIYSMCASFQGVARVSVQDLCNITGLTKQSVLKAQAYLMAEGLIGRLRKDSSRQKTCFTIPGVQIDDMGRPVKKIDRSINLTNYRSKKFTNKGKENRPHIDKIDIDIKRKNGNSAIDLEAPDSFRGKTTL